MPNQSTPTPIDVVILGGGLGGVAAAQRVCAAGFTCLLAEPTAWLGGQASSQGVSALDEHRFIEQFGASPGYQQMRQAIRERMADLQGVRVTDFAHYNPGNAWVSNLCFFPRIAHDVLCEFLHPYVVSGQLTILMHTELSSLRCHAQTIDLVVLTTGDAGDTPVCLSPRMVIDASECGDSLPAAHLTYVVGAENRADTGEALAPLEARPAEIQGFTYGFAVAYCPGEYHRIAKPEGYDELRDRQPFTLTLTSDAGEPRPFCVFTDGPTGLPPFWQYRRLSDGGQCQPVQHDIALINWNSNDYHHGSIIDVSAEVKAARLEEAKRLSLAFLYWMQSEMPRDDGRGVGYPELRLLPAIMGTHDGLSMAPYIRESRRTRGLRRIVAEDLLVSAQPQARARFYADSVGVGWYFMDLHPAPGNPRSMFAPTRPFQIPLGALIPPDCHNLVMGCKNIATTHLSNGSYRLHPVEWNIGMAAGACVVAALRHHTTPATVANHPPFLRQLQDDLLGAGQPLAWSVDVPPSSALFVATQRALMAGVITNDSPRANRLHIDVDDVLHTHEHARFQALVAPHKLPADATWRVACAYLMRRERAVR